MRHRLPTGVALHCVEQGLPDAPPLVLLHGYADSWFSFSRVIEALAERWRVIVPDQRGHGNSDRSASGYAVDDFARDVLDLLDVLHLPAATLAGHSMGSFIARRVAVLAPARIKHVVLIGTGTTARNACTDELLYSVRQLSDPVDTGFIREFQSGTMYASVPPDFFEGIMAESRKLPARLWKEVLEKLMNDPVDRDLERIAVPALVIGGDRDAIFPAADQEEVARRIPGAVLELQRDIGHCPQWEDPDAFVDIMRRNLVRPLETAASA